MKRISLFLMTNIAVLVVIFFIVSLFGLDAFLTANGLDLGLLLIFSAVIGFSGSIISLLMSKFIAKKSMGVHIIETPESSTELWLVDTVRKLAERAQIGMPEVGIYNGPPNAFATGASKNNSLVAVSTGLMQGMDREEVEAVLAHEVSHVANGDMVTLTLIQGVLNTFVIFLSRIVGYAVDSFLRRGSSSYGPGIGYMAATLISQVVFGILASIVVRYFSRRREFRADEGAASLMGQPNSMIKALQRLGSMDGDPLPTSMAASGISGGEAWSQLFSTHPPLEKRIEALVNRGQ